MNPPYFINFPALGIHLPFSPVIVDFSLFGFEIVIRWYGVLIALGLLLAVLYANKRADHFGLNRDRMFDVVLVAAIAGFIGARLYYVFFSSPYERAAYFAHPITILYIWQGGLGIYGGIIFAFVAALFMCRWRKVNTLAIFDIASLGFLIGQAIGRWGNFFNQEAHGGPTNLPWGMTGSIIGDSPVHPTFLYESLWCIAGFILLHIVSKKWYTFKGKIFVLYIMWYGLGRFFIEGLRTDSLMIGNLRVSQVVAVTAIILGGILYFVLRDRARHAPIDMQLATADGPGTDGAMEPGNGTGISTDEAEESEEDADGRESDTEDTGEPGDSENVADKKEPEDTEAVKTNKTEEPATSDTATDDTEAAAGDAAAPE